MDEFAVAIMPVADVEGWKQFCKQATAGDRAAGHKEFLRRGGITAEHIFHQQTPMGDLMVLIWEGIDNEGAAAHLGSVIDDPRSDHERYLREHVITELHGVDLDQPPPPPAQHVASTTV